jgi:hypothetical protein
MHMRFLAPAVVSLFLSGYLAAAEPMSAHTVTALMTNNTMNGKNLDKNRGLQENLWVKTRRISSP